jgi:hypothetical protein
MSGIKLLKKISSQSQPLCMYSPCLTSFWVTACLLYSTRVTQKRTMRSHVCVDDDWFLFRYLVRNLHKYMLQCDPEDGFRGLVAQAVQHTFTRVARGVLARLAKRKPALSAQTRCGENTSCCVVILASGSPSCD